MLKINRGQRDTEFGDYYLYTIYTPNLQIQNTALELERKYSPPKV